MSGASRRLRALASLSGSLTDALGSVEAAHLVEKEAFSALGAISAVVVTLGHFPHASTGTPGEPPTAVPPATVEHPQSLSVLHAIGLSAAVSAMLEGLPLDARVPLAEVARSGEPLFLHDPSELNAYPEWGAAMWRTGARAAAIVPVWANGELRGVLGLAWPQPCAFDDDERAFVLTLGVMCAQAIMRAHLRDAERAAREVAEHANKSKMRFLATISHELRTPMNAVIGYTDLVAEGIDGPVSERQREHLGRVRASSRHLLELIEELLSYARIEAGEAVVNLEPMRLADVLEESIVLVRPLIDTKGLLLRVVQPPRAVTLTTDRRKVRQILVNLLANAAKFTESGGIVLTVAAADTGGSGMVTFDVADTGRGVGAENSEKVFEPFWQEDRESDHGPGGTGLGLSVARQLARLLGGDLVLGKGASDGGARFIVTLPVSCPSAVAVPAAAVVPGPSA